MADGYFKADRLIKTATSPEPSLFQPSEALYLSRLGNFRISAGQENQDVRGRTMAADATIQPTALPEPSRPYDRRL